MFASRRKRRINAAAYTAVDRAEDEPDLAHAINATACEVIAAEAQKTGAWVVHYSSDYVYDGSGDRPWTESDATQPIGVYGASKLEGDMALTRGCLRHLIFRTSWVFDTWGSNFLKTILRASTLRPALTVVDDQWGAPTRAALIADEVTHQKMACLDPKCAARLAILDPELTVSQPPRVTACTGIDAIAHAVETAVTADALREIMSEFTRVREAPVTEAHGNEVVRLQVLLDDADVERAPPRIDGAPRRPPSRAAAGRDRERATHPARRGT